MLNIEKLQKGGISTGFKLKSNINISNPFKNFNSGVSLTRDQEKMVKKLAIRRKKLDNIANTGNSFGMSSGLQTGLSTAGSLFGSLSSGDLTSDQAATREGIRSAISSAGPIGAIIGAASGVVDAVGSITGLNLDNIDKNAAKRAGISGAASATNFINSLPGVSMFAGMFGSTTQKSNKSADIDELTNAYGSSVGDINAAQDLSNKRMLFGKKKANSFINQQNYINSLLTNINQQNKLAKSNTAAETYTSQNQNKYSGYTPQLILSKHGSKLPKLEEARKILNSWSAQTIEKNNVSKFQLGGKMNLIPEGELHARKHQLEQVDPNLEGQITKKGIPVVANAEGGIVQTAEIEKEEWTLRKEFTDQLEALYKKYQEEPSDEIAIEAGKLICYELLQNTDDRSGLIKSVK